MIAAWNASGIKTKELEIVEVMMKVESDGMSPTKCTLYSYWNPCSTCSSVYRKSFQVVRVQN